jgi:hypothetical protein
MSGRKMVQVYLLLTIVLILGLLRHDNVLIIRLKSMREGSVIYGLVNIDKSKAGNCKPLSSQAICVSWTSSSEYCRSTGGTMNGQTCYHPFNTPETCLSQPYCDTTKSLWDGSRCSEFCLHKNSSVLRSVDAMTAFNSFSKTNMAYPTTTTTSIARNNGNLCIQPWSWNSKLQICVRGLTPNECVAGGHMYVYKNTWMNGTWDSKAKCTAACDNPSLLYTPSATKV